MVNVYRDPREDVNEIDWVPAGKPYHIMVLEMHRQNQRVIMIHEAEGKC